MLGIKKYVPLLLLPVVFTACSSKLIRVEDGLPQAELLSSNEARLVFYRLEGDNDSTATIIIHDRIVGSLLPNHFALTRECKGTSRIGLVDSLKEEQVLHYNSPMVINGASNVYLKVFETGDGHFSLMQVDEERGKKDLSNLNAESHIINRYIPDCTPPAPPAPAPITIIEKSDPIVLQRIDLSADALFAFGKSQLGNMLPKGRGKLDELAKEIQSSNINVEKLKISGYTDRLGSNALNMKLSQARAQTVVDYFKAHGIAIPMEAVGYGSSSPITTWCKGPRSAKLIECLQPDRRVSIELIGQKTLSK